MYRILLIVASLFIFTACGSNKGIINLMQVELNKSPIFVVNHSATRAGVLREIEKWFSENGYDAKVVESQTQVNPENFVMTYSARWGWDIGTYMRLVEMRVMKNSDVVGSLSFDSVEYGGIDKFGDAETRLKILLDVLFGKLTREEAEKKLMGS